MNTTNASYFQKQDHAFVDYLLEYKKSYSDSELLDRESIFKENILKISEHNNANKSWKDGINMFTDVKLNEFFVNSKGINKGKLYNSHVESRYESQAQQVFKSIQFPSSIDWRNTGVVTPVKDQVILLQII